MTGHGGVPSSGTGAVALEIAVSGASRAGQLAAYPAGAPKPGTASLSYAAAGSVTQLVIVAPGAGGKVDLAISAGSARVSAGVVGYDALPGATQAGQSFVPVPAVRALSLATVKHGSPVSFPVTGRDGIPGSSVGAVIAQVTAASPAGAGSLTVYPAGKPEPAVPSVTYGKGAPATALVVVPPGAAGKITVAATGGATGVTFDVVGYHPLTGTVLGSVLVPVRATRIASTATGTGVPKQPVAAGKPLPVKVTGTSVVPASGASAVLLAVSAAGASAAARVTVYPAGAKAPAVTMASVGKAGTATALIPVTPGAGGKVDVAVSAGKANVSVDEVGYYIADRSPPAAVTHVALTRATASSVTLSWTDPADPDFADVVIRRATGSTPPATITSGAAAGTLKPGAATGTFGGLSAHTTYSFSLFARDSVGNTARAATITAMTDPATGGDCTDTFTGSQGPAWTDPGNWTRGKVPGASDWVCIPSAAQSLPVNLSGATATIDGITNAGGLDIEDSLTLADPASTSASTGPLTVDGTLNVAASLTVPGTLTLNGNLSGTVTVPAGGSLELVAGELVSGSLVNDGTATMPGSLNVMAGASLVNNGSLTMASQTVLDGECALAATPASPALPNGQFTDPGKVIIDATSGSPVVIGNILATLPAPPGTFGCLDTDDTGILDLAAGQLQIAGGNFNFDTGSTVTGAPTSLLIFEDDVSLNAQTTTIPVPLKIQDHTVGQGNLVVSDSLDMSGYPSGTGTITVSAGATMTVGTAGIVFSGSLVNDGTATIGIGAFLRVKPGASFVNNGSLLMLPGSDVDGDCPSDSTPDPLFTSPGPITTGSTNPGLNDVTPVEIGSGCMTTVESGQLDVVTGETDIEGSLFTFASGATVTGAASAKLVFLGFPVVSHLTAISGIGSIVNDGDLVLDNAITLPGLEFADDGTVELAPGVRVSLAAAPTEDSFGGTLQIDTRGPGDYGYLSVPGAMSAKALSIEVNNLGYTPSCGAVVIGLRAGSVSGGFGNVFIPSGAIPAADTWLPAVSSNAAGAYLLCPVPATPAGQTYGSGSGADALNPAGYVAEPVNTATGAYTSVATDARLAGLGIPFSFTRTYSSDDAYSGPLGPGWTDNLNTFLIPGGDSVTLTSGDGQVSQFTQNADGSYTGAAGVRSTLTAQGGGGWLLVRQDREHLTFSASGQLTSWTDRDGIGLSLSYNTAGQLTSVTDHAGRTVTFSYNAAGLLASMSFPPSRTVTYAYNGSGQLASVTNAAGGVTAYGYDPAGFLATVTDPDGHQVVANTYDDSTGRVSTQVNALGKTAAFSWNAATQTCTYTDPNGGQWQDVYDGDALIERIDPAGGITSYAYDSNLDRIAATDPAGNTTTYTYDANGNMLTETAPAPVTATQTWTYDSMNDVTSYTDERGATTRYGYDSRGNLITTTLPDGSVTTQAADPVTGAVTSVTDARGKTSTSSYDAAGDLTAVTDPAGDTTRYTYDAAGRRTTVTDPAGHATTTAYDALDRVTSATDPAADTTSYTYDAAGNETSVTDGDGHTTTFAYDADNELTSVSAPDGGTTSYTYDPDGNRASLTTGDGHKTTYAYDTDDRLVAMTNPLGQATAYGYDADGDLVSTRDPMGVTMSDTYDAVGRLTRVSYSDGTPAETYAYDPDGNRVMMTDGTGTTSYTYNSRNELTAVTSPQGGYSYGYDADGDLTSETTPDGAVATRAFDAAGRLASVAVDGKTTTFGYDADSELTSTALPNGVTESRGYTPAGRVSEVRDASGATTISDYAYAYDQAGNPVTQTVNGQPSALTYNSDERLASVCYGGASCPGGQESWTYDADGNRLSQAAGGTTTSYAYNSADEPTKATTGTATTTYGYNADGEQTSAGPASYAYNAAGELTSATSASGGTTAAYTYTGDGLPATATVGTAVTTFAYDPASAVPELTDAVTGGATIRYTWANGQTLLMRSGGTDYGVGHDALGSTVDLTSGSGGTAATDSYDPFGNLRASTGSVTSPLGWEAEYQDPVTGLDQLGARDLDTATGQFLSMDPVGPPAAGPAISPYAYSRRRADHDDRPDGRHRLGH